MLATLPVDPNGRAAWGGQIEGRTLWPPSPLDSHVGPSLLSGCSDHLKPRRERRSRTVKWQIDRRVVKLDRGITPDRYVDAGDGHL
jgi:hypothetical protein